MKIDRLEHVGIVVNDLEAATAFFVDLGALTDPALVTATVASTLRVSVQSADPLPALMSFLQTKRVLIVLDNCEHVINAAASLAEAMFNGAASAHILATSREALRVEGEHAHWLHPLEFPAPHVRLLRTARRPPRLR